MQNLASATYDLGSYHFCQIRVFLDIRFCQSVLDVLTVNSDRRCRSRVEICKCLLFMIYVHYGCTNHTSGKQRKY